MRKSTVAAIAAIAAGLVGIYFVGKFTGNANRGKDSQGTAQAPSDGIERARVPLEGTAKGPANALVTIVAFSDFQCPFCGRVIPTLERIEKEYAGKVRVYFRHYPLPFHADAPLASEAALEADAQGKFWQMHDKLFANQQAIKRPDLEKYAQELGLDMAKVKVALDTNAYKARIDRDMALGQKVGVNGTPAFFVNGRLLSGAQPYDAFKKLIDEEIASAQKLVAKGVAPEKIYDTLMQGASDGPPKPKDAPPSPPRVSTEVYKVPVGGAPTRGGKQPKVTIVEYSEFQCPFCGKVTPTLDEMLKTYGDDLQVVFKHYPLPARMHPNAFGAALAAEAAREQGKFWEMHDKLFANQQTLDAASLEKYAQEIGLDVAKFKAAIEAPKTKDAVDADQKEGNQFGVRGTPTSFINGRMFRGAQPKENFKAVIDEELKKADAKLKAGVARGQLYSEIIKDGLDKAAEPPPRPEAPVAAGGVQKVELGDAPVKGAKDALVTIVQFSDFQCPFCSRVEPTVDKVMAEYKGKVRVAWKDLPLPMHQNALPAAVAARAAGEQGKFWEMHDKLFANQQSLNSATLEKHAAELGLDVARFKASLDGDKLKKAVEVDSAQAAKLGANGTPAFFINGVSLSGAQPFENFKPIIDAELRKAEALVAKGTPRAKVYETIMKNAKVGAPTPAPGAEPSPEADTKVYAVNVGGSPARGPKNAPITMVVFSDFQCPFCKKVEPTLTQIEKEYAGKVRTVWKNYPLPFHNNAKPAAEAAMAAGDQGKFWEMHDKLFENQTALDRASLEKYAQELGLDMAKFKASLDANKHAAQIEAETKQGQSVNVNGTPATFINGRMLSGAYPYEAFKKLVDQELAKKNPVAARRRG